MNARISLRVSTYLWMDEQRCAELLDLVREYRDTLDEVAFFTGFTHPPLPLATLRARARRLAVIQPQFRAAGLAVGINHLSTMGHLDENLDNSLQEPWQHLVDISGAVSKSCYCVADPAMQAYVRDSYVALAETKPDFIWVDDDVRLESHPPSIHMACLCERCLAAFAAQTGVARTREQLAAAFHAGSREARLTLRRQWLEHNRRYIGGLLAQIREAVDVVDRTVPLGLMTGGIAYSGYGFAEWAGAMAGAHRVPVKWRPGGGFYTDDTPAALLDKAHSVGRQTGLLPVDIRDVQWEHENFPYQVLRKSRRVFAAEGGAAIGAGCTGIALNLMGISQDPFDEYRPYFEAVRGTRALYDKAVGAFGRSACEGLWCAFTPDHLAAQQADGDWTRASTWGGDFSTYNELAEIGLPLAYTREGARLTILSAESCLEFSREALIGMLGGGVLLDGPALARLNEMGMSAHTGFAVRDRKEKDTLERLSRDSLNGAFAGWHRDCRPSFWGETTYLLEPLTPQSRVLAEVIDFAPKSFGPGAGCFENALGGRVAVLGYYPWRSLQSLAKTTQMKSLCRWLSGDALPAYVASFHKIAVWCRRDRAGRPALLLLNASLDPAEGVDLRIRDAQEIAVSRAGTRMKRLSRATQDGPYGAFMLPRLEPWEFAVLTTR